MRFRLAKSIAVLALLALALPAQSAADHVTASPTASAHLGKEISDQTWEVVIDWAINCGGVTSATYGGDLGLVDQITREVIPLGGVFSASGQDSVYVGRRATPRYLFPQIKAWCASGPPELHGSGTVEGIGSVVEIPPIGDGSGGDHGAQGGRDFPDLPGDGFGGPTDPLRPNGCGRKLEGTSSADKLKGTATADLIIGLAGDDKLTGLASNDCLIGDEGNDTLSGGKGTDRLTGGEGNDTLSGGKQVNRYDAGAGDDSVNAVNKKRELVSCGTGNDRARVDKRDRVAGCEHVTRVRARRR